MITVVLEVKDLPECYEKECLMRLATSEHSVVTAVAKIGAINDWAAYIGWPDPCVDGGSEVDWYRGISKNPDRVMQYGDKLQESTARYLFPEYKDKHYRS